MFRILEESFENYKKDFVNNHNDFRYKVMEPFELFFDTNRYSVEKSIESDDYKKISDFIWLLNNQIEKYPSYNSMIWTLESRNITGRYFGILTNEEFDEQLKIIGMFLKLSYWN